MCQDQPAHTHSLIRAFASRLNILRLLTKHHLEFLSCKVRLSLHLSKCQIVGNHMRRLNFVTNTIKVEEAQQLNDGKLTICILGSFACFFLVFLLIFFSNFSSQKAFRDAIRMSYRLDTDQT